MENLLRTGFERGILRKIGNRHSYYHKEISWSRQFFQEKKVNIDLNRNFQLHISFLKYVTKIFCISYYFQQNFLEYFKMLSVALSVYILLNKGANQLQVLYIRTLGNIQENLLHGILFYWSCGPQLHSRQYFLEICRSFRTTSKKLVQENYVFAYHISNKGPAKTL